MKKIFMSTLLLATVIFTGCGDLNETNKLIIGLDDEYAPMGFRDERNAIVGFDVDLAKEVARRMGVTVEFRPIDWTKKEEELDSGRIDMIWNGLDITPERREKILFSKPYMDNRQIVFVKYGENPGIVSAVDLAGKIVGTQAGSTAEDYIETNAKLKNSFRELKTFNSYMNALNALGDGEIDALICDEIVGRYAMNKSLDKFEALDITIGDVSQFGIGFRKDNVELRDKVQTVFDEIIKDGTAKKISENWFQADLINVHR